MNCMKKEANTINQPRPPPSVVSSELEIMLSVDFCLWITPDSTWCMPPNDMFSVMTAHHLVGSGGQDETLYPVRDR